MRYFLILPLFACGSEVPYGPTEQDFEEFESWGDGIPGFEISQGGPTDTGGGSGGMDVNGVYLGDYSVTISRDDYGDNCNGGASLTVAVADGSISVGQGTQISLACGTCSDGLSTDQSTCESMGQAWSLTTTEYISMRFRGDFDETGLILGDVFEESVFNIQLTWTGVFSNGVLAGSFAEYVSSDQGMINVSGQVNVIKN